MPLSGRNLKIPLSMARPHRSSSYGRAPEYAMCRLVKVTGLGEKRDQSLAWKRSQDLHS